MPIITDAIVFIMTPPSQMARNAEKLTCSRTFYVSHSELSSDAVVEKDMARARRLGRVSLCISVTGIILTFLTVGLVLAFLAKDDNNGHAVSNMDFLSHVHVPGIDEDFEEFEEIPIEVPVIF